MKKKWITGLLLAFIISSMTACQTEPKQETKPNTEVSIETSDSVQSVQDIPAYQDKPYVVINDNEPFFEEDEFSTKAFESYSELDELGRCGVAYANIGKEIMPTEKRGEIGMVKPSGWKTAKYDCVDGKYLYNRCHLIGYQLSGENANEKNLITGTRYMNVEGMLPFENQIDDYVEETGHHVFYRVTPIYEGSNLVASGVEMEAASVEDDKLRFHVYCYNVQPGVEINYADGSSKLAGEKEEEQNVVGDVAYIGNKNSHIFHRTSCESVQKMKKKNQVEFVLKNQALDEGYKPCQSCNP